MDGGSVEATTKRKRPESIAEPLFALQPAAELLDQAQAESRADLLEATQRGLDRFADRRRAERALAHYIETVVCEEPETFLDDRIQSLPESLRACRACGVWGHIDHRPVTIWRHKCDVLQLCPDAAREEQDRVAERYTDEIERLHQAGFHVYKAVIAPRNYAAGSLKAGKSALFKRFSAMRRARWPRLSKHLRTIDDLPADPADYPRVLQRRMNVSGLTAERCLALRGPIFPEIKGALVTQENPLGRYGDWNVHLNVFLICDRRLDYGKLRRWWGCQIEIIDRRGMIRATRQKLAARKRDVSKLTDAEVFREAIAECVKYPVQSVPEKAKGVGAWHGGVFLSDRTGEPIAPAMIYWPAKAWLEWWRAERGFHRTRSYGLLYGIETCDDDDTLPLDQFEKLGTVRFNGSRYVFSMAGLGSIPQGGKVAHETIQERGQTGPPGWSRAELVRRIMDAHREAWEKNRPLAC